MWNFKAIHQSSIHFAHTLQAVCFKNRWILKSLQISEHVGYLAIFSKHHKQPEWLIYNSCFRKCTKYMDKHHDYFRCHNIYLYQVSDVTISICTKSQMSQYQFVPSLRCQNIYVYQVSDVTTYICSKSQMSQYLCVASLRCHNINLYQVSDVTISISTKSQPAHCQLIGPTLYCIVAFWHQQPQQVWKRGSHPTEPAP